MKNMEFSEFLRFLLFQNVCSELIIEQLGVGYKNIHICNLLEHILYRSGTIAMTLFNVNVCKIRNRYIGGNKNHMSYV